MKTSEQSEHIQEQQKSHSHLGQKTGAAVLSSRSVKNIIGREERTLMNKYASHYKLAWVIKQQQNSHSVVAPMESVPVLLALAES
jgi:hypothetical protein